MRISCCIPHCKRTRRHDPDLVVVDGRVLDFGDEWICQKHWSVLPPALRREHVTAKRKVKRLGDMESEIASATVWRRCKDKASEIAFGLS
ncbi:hypothetical protein [Rhizobium sp. BK176]|uniref:hypothetical protein n=1 Tax=Rhizobium sp. BK176 TaxID=2587071 RepID=UPI002168B1F7|nr:hypothetical protein [Rhizobium sp. BK176]MCS4088866.1 hypothetical protein [Rhizobium sp. BK176]